MNNSGQFDGSLVMGLDADKEYDDDDDEVVNPPSTDVTTRCRADQLSPAALLPAAAQPGREPCIMYLVSTKCRKSDPFL